MMSEAPSVQNRPRVAGKAARDVKLQADGKADKIEGEVRHAIGALKEALEGKLGVAAACLVPGDLGPRARRARVFNFAQTLRVTPA
jgi:hypothetical protein